MRYESPDTLEAAAKRKVLEEATSIAEVHRVLVSEG